MLYSIEKQLQSNGDEIFYFPLLPSEKWEKEKCRAEFVTTSLYMTINHNFMGKKYKQGDWNFVGAAQKCQYQLRIHCLSRVSLCWDALPKTVESLSDSENCSTPTKEKNVITICQVAFKFYTFILVQTRRNSLFAQYVPRKFYPQFSLPRKTLFFAI